MIYKYNNYLEFITLLLDNFQWSKKLEVYFKNTKIQYKKQVVKKYDILT